MVNQAQLNEPIRKRLLEEAYRRKLLTPDQAVHALEWYDLAGLQQFLREASPHFTWDWEFQIFIQVVLGSLKPDSGRKIIFEVPIRHGKSELITKHYPLSLIKADPRTKVGLGCHTAELAAKFGRSMLKTAKKQGIDISPERATSIDWETTAGGGFHGAGVGGALSGYGFHHIGLDDPIKNRKDAESLIVRESVWEWLQDDLITRKESPGTNVLGVMSRWHEDDPVGRLQEGEDADQWEFYFMPAIAEEGDILERKEGDALCPERFNREFLGKEKVRLGNYAFSGLYQQRPVPRDGAMFNANKVRYMDIEEMHEMIWPSDPKEKGIPAVLSFDLGATVLGDETAGVCIAGPTAEGDWLVADAMHGDWEPDERDQHLDAFVSTFPESGVQAIVITIPQDPGQAGKEQARRFVKRWAKYNVKIVRPTGSKEIRADAYAAQWNAGNVIVARAPWTRPYVSEHCSFPLGRQDNMVDCSSDAYNTGTGRGTGKMKTKKRRLM